MTYLTPTICFSLAALSFWAMRRFLLWHMSLAQPDAKEHPLPADFRGPTLRPVELSYILHPGDMINVLATLVVDLLQRTVKKDSPGLPETAGYEQQLLDSVQSFVSNWTFDKVNQKVPLAGLKKLGKANIFYLLPYLPHLPRLYKFLTQTLHRFVSEIASDPRHLKRYFNLTGVIRLLTELVTSGYYQVVDNEIVQYLQGQGLLVQNERRVRYAQILFGCCAIALIAICIYFGLCLIDNFGQPTPYGVYWFLCFAALANSFALRIIRFLTGLIPFHDEVTGALRYVKRNNWRIRLLRLIVLVIKSAASTLMGLSLLVLLLIDLAVFKQMNVIDLWPLIPLLVAFTFSWYMLLGLYLSACNCMENSQPTTKGLALANQIRNSLGKESAFDAFRELLLDPDYTPRFSYLLAIYGIEALLIMI